MITTAYQSFVSTTLLYNSQLIAMATHCRLHALCSVGQNNLHHWSRISVAINIVQTPNLYAKLQ